MRWADGEWEGVEQTCAVSRQWQAKNKQLKSDLVLRHADTASVCLIELAFHQAVRHNIKLGDHDVYCLLNAGKDWHVATRQHTS